MILISIDTLRADHLGCYGYARDTSPNIDRLARDGVLFEWAFSTGGATLPVHMSLLTSLPFHAHDVNDASGRRLDPKVDTLAERLASAGYRTGAFVGGGYVQRKWGFDQGFGVFEEVAASFSKILPRAEQWIKEDPSRRFFLFLHTLDVHSDTVRLPYDAPEPFRDRFVDPGYSGSFDGCRRGKCASELLAWFNTAVTRGEVGSDELFAPEEVRYMISLYDGGIAHADWELGRFLDFLRGRELYDDALIVLLADHGEEFLEHGLLLHHENFDEVSHVPLIVKLPEKTHAGERVDGLVSLLDVMPTILELAGVSAPASVQGQSLLPLIAGGRPGRPFVYLGGGTEKVRTSRWSLRASPSGPIALFDLASDPGERSDVSDRYPDVTRDLSSKLRESRHRDVELRRHLLGEDAQKVEIGEETERQLRALGYLH